HCARARRRRDVPGRAATTVSRAVGAPASDEARRKSIEEWRQLMARYPLHAPWDLATPAAGARVGNGLVAWFVATGGMSPLELVVLVLLEGLLLGTVAWCQLRFVPEHARPHNAAPLAQRVGTLAFA